MNRITMVRIVAKVLMEHFPELNMIAAVNIATQIIEAIDEP